MPRGAFRPYRLECGHWVHCYGREPVPECTRCGTEPEQVMPGQFLLPVDKKFIPLPETP